MKLMKRTQIYKAQNVTFNPATLEAFSYSWWKFVALIEGKVVFNNYRYSVTTTKHQVKVRRLMQELNIMIDIEAPFASGLKEMSLVETILQAEENLCDQFLNEESKKISRNEKAKQKRIEKQKLANHLAFLNGFEKPKHLQLVENS